MDSERAGAMNGTSFGGLADADPLAVAGRTPAIPFRRASAAPAASFGPCGPPPRRPGALGAKAGETWGPGRSPFGSFRRKQQGVAAIEVAFSCFVLVLALAGLMGIVHTVYESDRLDRAARAAARAVALLASAPATAAALETVACRAIRNELGLGATFDCGATWTLDIDAFENPAALLADTPRTGADAVIGGENGDMIRVRIAALVEAMEDSDGEDDDSDGDTDGGASEPLDVLAAAVARNERAG